MLMAGFVVHRSIHMARADAHAVIHTHSKAGVAVSCQKQGLLPINLGAMHLHDKIAYYDCEGVTNEAEESEHIAKALGNKNVAILRNHGLLTCGPTMGHAFHLMRRLEMSCETQVMAQSGGAELIFPPMDVVKKPATRPPNWCRRRRKTPTTARRSCGRRCTALDGPDRSQLQALSAAWQPVAK